MIQVTINGTRTELQPGTDLSQLLEKLKMPPERVAVEVNLSVIDKQKYSQFPIQEGDQIEIIGFVGGGN